jgi:hypothetical protein
LISRAAMELIPYHIVCPANFFMLLNYQLILANLKG